MINNKLSLSALAMSASLALAGAANASIIISGGSHGFIPDTANENQITTDLTPLSSTWEGYYGSTINLSAAANVKVEFLGFEAKAANTFTYEGISDPAFDTEAAAYLGENKVLPFGTSRPIPKPWDLMGVFPTFTAASGLQPIFEFFTARDGGHTVANGSNPDDSVAVFTEVNFFASCNNSKKTECRTVTLFFDDDGGDNDDNHDDLVVRMTFLRGEIPVPAAIFPLLTAVAGLGGLARMRRNKKKA